MFHYFKANTLLFEVQFKHRIQNFAYTSATWKIQKKTHAVLILKTSSFKRNRGNMLLQNLHPPTRLNKILQAIRPQ
jgi:hypothetical protein